jgi:hypothetical protein
LKDADDIDRLIENYSLYIDGLISKVCGDIYMLSNPVLNKNPLASKLLENYLNDEQALQSNIFFILKKLFRCYWLSVMCFAKWFLQAVAFKLGGHSYSYKRRKEPIVFVDTYFIADRILEDDCVDKHYLMDIDRLFEKNNQKFTFVPFFYQGKNPWNFYRIAQAFKKQSNSYLTEYNLLKWRDLLSLVVYIVCYPIKVLKLANSISPSSKLSGLTKFELINTLDDITLNSYIRYRFGLQLGRKFGDIKLISWCEYQDLNKNLYKGIRAAGNQSTIYGCQFFLKPFRFVSLDIPDSDKQWGTPPDIVLVNGERDLPDSSQIEHRVGISLRYQKLFESEPIVDTSSDRILLLLSPSEEESENMMNLILSTTLKDKKVYIKSHPSKPLSDNISLPDLWQKVEGNICELFKDVSLVIVAACSGSGVEAVASGISVIAVENPKSFLKNPLCELGQGEIWGNVFDDNGLEKKYSQLIDFREQHPDKIRQLAYEYRRLFFSKYSDEKFLDMFEL